MPGRDCWVIENYAYRRCPDPARLFTAAVSIHNHSCYSVEKLASLNEVVRLGFMRPFRHILQTSFGFGDLPSLDYSEIHYRPPLSPGDILRAEVDNAALFGFHSSLVAITDHDEIAGSVELARQHPSAAAMLGEELSFRFQGHLFHLGIVGLPPASITATHAALQAAAQRDDLDSLFEQLHASQCLVILNHPMVRWSNDPQYNIPVEEFLSRYGWAIHALEYNGMRDRSENDRVLALAQHVGKPVVGGGDSHLLLASSVVSLTQAASFAEFAAEVKSGRAVSLVMPMHFAPLSWKIFLRVVYFMAHYRRIGYFRGQPVAELLAGRRVLLDPVGAASRGFLRMADLLRLIR